MMSFEEKQSAAQVDNSPSNDPDRDNVERIDEQESESTRFLSVERIESGVPEIVLAVLVFAALGILAFAFSSCF
jgi:hypothetical protein